MGSLSYIAWYGIPYMAYLDGVPQDGIPPWYRRITHHVITQVACGVPLHHYMLWE